MKRGEDHRLLKDGWKHCLKINHKVHRLIRKIRLKDKSIKIQRELTQDLFLPVQLNAHYFYVDQRREADSDRVDPKHGDVLLDAAVSDDVLVPERLCKRR